jgi:hypothetical protein
MDIKMCRPCSSDTGIKTDNPAQRHALSSENPQLAGAGQQFCADFRFPVAQFTTPA